MASGLRSRRCAGAPPSAPLPRSVCSNHVSAAASKRFDAEMIEMVCAPASRRRLSSGEKSLSLETMQTAGITAAPPFTRASRSKRMSMTMVISATSFLCLEMFTNVAPESLIERICSAFEFAELP